MKLTEHDSTRKPVVHAVDLFCGAGGLTYGLRLSGVKVTAGVDVDGECAYAYAHNNDALFIEKSVEEMTGEEISRLNAGADYTLLAGCAPCQAFSTYNPKANPSDPRWHLLRQFARLVRENQPDLVTMENVPGLKSKDVFQEFLQCLGNCGYWYSWKVVQCEDYGLPQHRHRLVLLASRQGPVEVLTPEEFGATRRSVRDAIGKLPPVDAGCASPGDPLHKARGLSSLNLRRMLASKPGGTWRDWSEELRLPCHGRDTGASYGSVYGRIEWDLPSPTITTQFIGYGSGRFGHPEQNRALTLREGAILQNFPEDYAFVEPGKPVELAPVARMIGNAVPVTIGELIGRSIFAHLDRLASRRSS